MPEALFVLGAFVCLVVIMGFRAARQLDKEERERRREKNQAA